MATGEDRPKRSRKAMKLHGYLAEYDNVDDLIAACERVRDAGFTRWDAHSPFPVHGIDEAMGIRPTILPWIVLVGGLLGLSGALLMQWWMNAVDYPYLISGKPYFSLPANIPICFELTVLLSAVTAFLSVLGLNLLPQLYHPLFRSERFLRFSDDRFFISIEARDPAFRPIAVRALLEGQPGTLSVEEVKDLANPRGVPKPVIGAAVVCVFLSFIPLAVIARARVSTSEKPRIHLVWDMDWQKKYKPQQASPLFADGRAMRPQVEGTIARGDLVTDANRAFLTGLGTDGAPVTTIPMTIDDALMARGRQRFEIYCAPCHGLTGHGDGMVHRRATQLKEKDWVPPLTYHSDALRRQPVGQMFQTITHGVRTMPSYGSQVPPADRWAIILYIRALQRSFAGSLDDVPADRRAELKQD